MSSRATLSPLVMLTSEIKKRAARRWTLLRPVRRNKVFGIGLPKTGTKTLGQCLTELGFKHRSFDMELAALAKRNELENVMAEATRYESFEDWPWFFVYRELDQKFPGSKFILTLRRDTPTYIESLRKHHGREGLRRADFVKPRWWDDVWDFQPAQWDYQKAAQRYENHNRAVLEYFRDRADDLLVVCWEAGDGWDKLCGFLNRRRPDKPFPHLNDHRTLQNPSASP